MAITITVVSPTPGGQIARDTPLVVDVVSSTTLQRAFVSVSIGGIAHDEVVHRGAGSFSPTFSNATNDRSVIVGGYRFTILRDGGWPGTPTLHVDAVDLP